MKFKWFLLVILLCAMTGLSSCTLFYQTDFEKDDMRYTEYGMFGFVHRHQDEEHHRPWGLLPFYREAMPIK